MKLQDTYILNNTPLVVHTSGYFCFVVCIAILKCEGWFFINNAWHYYKTVASQAAGDAVQATGDVAQASGGIVQAIGDTVQATGDAVQEIGDIVQASGDAPQTTRDIVQATGDIDLATASCNYVSGDGGLEEIILKIREKHGVVRICK